MEFMETLLFYKAKIEEELKKFLEQKQKDSKSFGSFTDESWELFKDYTLRGGKRIRPTLCIMAYRGVSSDLSDTKILKPAMALEFMQGYLLVHDDIMDQSRLRRGKPTAHEWVKNWYLENISKNEEKARRFGESMAILIGDIYNHFGIQCITDSDFPLEKKVQVAQIYNTSCEKVGKGQILDIWFGEEVGKVSEKDYFEMIFRKTTMYTTRCPIQMGCLLGDARPEQTAALMDYATPIAQAFQVQDDVIDLFSADYSTGKGRIGEDIREGKNTLMIIKAFEFGDEEQKNFLKSVLGNRNAPDEDIEKAKQVLLETGAVDYAKNKVSELITQAKDILLEIEIAPETKEFFTGFADFMATRKY